MSAADIHAHLASRGNDLTIDIPWKGPIVGPATAMGRASWIAVGGASDPALGNALAAAFVPGSADRREGRFVAGGELHNIVALRPIAIDDDSGWFRAQIQTEFLASQAEAVLMVLIYNEWKFGQALPRSTEELFGAAAVPVPKSAAEARALAEKSGDYLLPIAVTVLPNPRVVLAPLEALLAQLRYEELRPAIIEVRPGLSRSDRRP